MMQEVCRSRTCLLIASCILFLWVGAHLPSIQYGTANTPLHASYWSADEQSPVNGALHILKEKSILGMRNENTLYYGPVFAVIALPAVVADLAVSFVFDGVRTAEQYKDKVVWDWGGILAWARLIAVCTGFLGLVAVFLLFGTTTVNPHRVSWMPYAAAGLLGVSYFYFEHASFFRHWVFVVVFLLVQLYFTVRLVEQEGRGRWLWVGQGALILAAFGVSYLSLVYQVFWLPVLVYWMRKKNWQGIRNALLYGVFVVAGLSLVVWWHPYAFIRLLGLLGIIEPIAIGSALGLTENTAQGNSFLWYAQLVVTHTWPLLLAALIVCIRHRAWTHFSAWWVWALFLPAAVNYVVFSMPPHHEARYMLPTVVLLSLLTFAIFSVQYQVILGNIATKRIVLGLIGFWAVLNVVQIAGWTRMMAAGPVERSTIIPQILAWQEADPETRVLLLGKGWPLGWVHTQEAYAEYVERRGMSKYELWKYIHSHTGPEGVAPINVYYVRELDAALTDAVASRYSHVARFHPPAVGEDLVWESPQDEFDIRPWNVWRFREYQARYEIVKE